MWQASTELELTVSLQRQGQLQLLAKLVVVRGSQGRQGRAGVLELPRADQGERELGENLDGRLRPL